MNQISFEEAIDLAIKKDSTYPADAYLLVREALDFSVEKMHEGEDSGQSLGEPKELRGEFEEKEDSAEEETIDRHVTGPQLLEGFREVVLNSFGPLASTVLKEWNLQKTDDIGRIVYNLIGTKAFGKREDDKIEDFFGVYDFEEAFDRPFLPPSQRVEGKAAGNAKNQSE